MDEIEAFYRPGAAIIHACGDPARKGSKLTASGTLAHLTPLPG